MYLSRSFSWISGSFRASDELISKSFMLFFLSPEVLRNTFFFSAPRSRWEGHLLLCYSRDSSHTGEVRGILPGNVLDNRHFFLADTRTSRFRADHQILFRRFTYIKWIVQFYRFHVTPDIPFHLHGWYHDGAIRCEATHK